MNLPRALRIEPAQRALWGVILLFFAAQVWFVTAIGGLRPVIDEIPPTPSEHSLKAMSFGDDEFLFRYMGRWLQFIGDGGGRIRPLHEYDYDRVVDWLAALDRLDDGRSDYGHELAARYFGEITPSVDPGFTRLRKIVDFLRITALRDPAREWPWLVWAAHKARNPMNDSALTEALARDLQSPELKDKSVPAWVRVLPVQLYHAAGNDTAAREALAAVTPEDRKEVEAMREALERKMRAFRRGGDAAIVAPEDPAK
jgi:hypothetical protein